MKIYFIQENYSVNQKSMIYQLIHLKKLLIKKTYNNNKYT